MAERPQDRGPGGPTAVFRLDFGGARGWGHLVRCDALAGELVRRGWSTILWTASDPAGVPAALREAFQEVIAAPVTGWGDIPERIRHAEWFILDHYDIDDAALSALRAQVSGRILGIDDEAHRRFGAVDIVLNSRLGLRDTPYAEGVRALLGESHALLRPALSNPKRVSVRFATEVNPILVMMGGTDPRGITGTVLEAIAEEGVSRFAPIVIRPGRAAADEAILRVFERFPHRAWPPVVDAAELAGWAAGCRYAVSAAGGTLLELALLRVPFVSVVVAANQRPLAQEAGRRWGMPVVDAENEKDLRHEMTQALRKLIDRCAGADFQAAACFAEIDDRGAARVADAMTT